MAEDVFKTSIEGKDVVIADPLDLSTSAKYPSVIIEESKFGIIDHTINYNIVSGNNNIATIPHGYSGVPKVLVYCSDNDNDYTIPLPMNIEGFGFPYLRCRADSTNLYIEIYNFEAFSFIYGVDFTARSFKFKYFIFPSLVG